MPGKMSYNETIKYITKIKHRADYKNNSGVLPFRKNEEQEETI